MNKVYKLFTIGVLCAALFAGGLSAKPHGKRPMPPKPKAEHPMPPADSLAPRPDGMSHGLAMPGRHGQEPVTFHPNRFCYVPQMQAYVAIDSIDCAIDLVVRHGDQLELVGRHVTDSLYKRHDLKNIHRPKSVWVLGDKIIYLASSALDSAHIGILDMKPAPSDKEGEPARLQYAESVSYIGLDYNAFAFDVNVEAGELTVVGYNPQGYSIEIFDISDFPNNITVKENPYNYRKKKQAETIKESDPYGVGLTVVAVSVVFIALICVCLIMIGYGSAIRSFTNRKKKDKAPQAEAAASVVPDAKPSVDGDVYAAIATAIYLYNEELHDDEDMVLTIQDVQRAWTPWNDKRFNMNQYFNRK